MDLTISLFFKAIERKTPLIPSGELSVNRVAKVTELFQVFLYNSHKSCTLKAKLGKTNFPFPTAISTMVRMVRQAVWISWFPPKGAVDFQFITVKMYLSKCPKEAGKCWFRPDFCIENECKNEVKVMSMNLCC